MSVTVGAPRADDIPQPGEPAPEPGPAPQPGAARRPLTVPVIPTQARPADPVTGTPTRSTAPARPASGAFVGRVPPPMPAKLPSVPQQRPVRGKPVRLPKRGPTYQYELSGIDDILASDAVVDREERRYQDRRLRHTGYKVLLAALAVVVVVTVIAAFGVANIINGLLSLLP